jgi:hypothetical protein
MSDGTSVDELGCALELPLKCGLSASIHSAATLLTAMESSAQFRCQNHFEKRADRECVCCEKPICGECAMPSPSGAWVCSMVCQDRLVEMAQERKEAEKFDPWPVRILSSLFLIVLLAVLGTLAGAWFGMRSGTHRYRHHERYYSRPDRPPPLTAEQFNTRLKWHAIIGGLSGAGCAVCYLARYYSRRLD